MIGVAFRVRFVSWLVIPLALSAGLISGDGGVIKEGLGTLQLSAANTFTGYYVHDVKG